jgi:hypothetical protein
MWRGVTHHIWCEEEPLFTFGDELVWKGVTLHISCRGVKLFTIDVKWSHYSNLMWRGVSLQIYMLRGVTIQILCREESLHIWCGEESFWVTLHISNGEESLFTYDVEKSHSSGVTLHIWRGVTLRIWCVKESLLTSDVERNHFKFDVEETLFTFDVGSSHSSQTVQNSRRK